MAPPLLLMSCTKETEMSEWSNKEYVNWIYRTLLHRDADESGLDHFSNRLESGEDLKNIVEMNRTGFAGGSNF
ncbi:DUF4214 domain-containing protein [Agrobacterium tumefaciens]|nr:DUF4214 domain-containing protein [Agrobacterium tumefaciens]